MEFKEHGQSFKNDLFCIPRATLRIYQKDCCIEHCSDTMHKYSAKSKNFIENLPECVKKLSTKVDETLCL